MNDNVTDQVEDVAPIGDKLNYKGANYRLGQPFLTNGDLRIPQDANRVISDSQKEIETELNRDRYKKDFKIRMHNQGAHFDY